MATRNFVIARSEEEALTQATYDYPIGTGFETVEQARLNLQNIKDLIPFLPPTHGGTDYHIYRIEHRVKLVE